VTISQQLGRLINANATLWAGEAEVARTYWDSPVRTHETDLLWLARQCRKELCGGFLRHFAQLASEFNENDRGIDRHEALELAEIAFEELSHYCILADVYDALCQDTEPLLDTKTVKEQADWPENTALSQLRAEHWSRGRLGQRAYAITEGGYCAVFAEGMKLKGRGGADDLIAEACAKIYDDEFDHMLRGIIGLEKAGLGEGDWTMLTEMTVAQMKQRIRMRNAQFSRPLKEARVEEILAGEIEPVAFDYERAGLLSH